MLHRYYVYILTNALRTVLYVGVTNNIEQRLNQHTSDAMGNKTTFAGKYNCIYLVYYEEYQWIQAAISREKEIKKWRREKKLALIEKTNPEFNFLNVDILN